MVPGIPVVVGPEYCVDEIEEEKDTEPDYEDSSS